MSAKRNTQSGWDFTQQDDKEKIILTPKAELCINGSVVAGTIKSEGIDSQIGREIEKN